MDKAFRIKLRWLILLSTLVRILFANLLELGNDEVYYYTYALQPDWNHFDHPPLIGFLIKFFTLNLHWVNTFSMRLGAICLAVLNTWIIACIVRRIANDRAAFIAAILFTASIYSSIISGIFILPDSICNTFWLAALYCMVLIVKPTDQKEQTEALLFLGIWIGLACMSKVHGIFLWLGFLGYLFLHQRSLLKNWALYVSLIISALIISPIVLWNIQHDFITWRFHGERVSLLDAGIQIDFFLQAFFGQVLYNNPLLCLIYVYLALAVIKNWKFHTKQCKKEIAVILYCGLPIILTASFISLFKQVLPHWSGADFFSIMILAAVWIDQELSMEKIRTVRKVFNGMLIFTLGFMILAVCIIHFYPGNPIGIKNGKDLGKEDVSIEMIGWEQFAKEFEKIRAEDMEQKTMEVNDPILVNKWFPAGHILFYVARPLEIPVLGEGKLHDLHKFAWLNSMENPIQRTEDAYFISPSNNHVDPEVEYGQDFESIDLRKVIQQKRGGAVVRKWYIYHLKGAKRVLGSSGIKDHLQ